MQCPFCKQEMEDLEIVTIKRPLGVEFLVGKKICRNVEKHYGNGKIIVPYRIKEKKNEV